MTEPSHIPYNWLIAQLRFEAKQERSQFLIAIDLVRMQPAQDGCIIVAEQCLLTVP